MKVKSFGYVLVGMAIFIGIALFMFSEWIATANFMTNLRYAAVLEIGERALEYVDGKMEWVDPISVSLGQALLVPLGILIIGVLVVNGAISKNVLSKVFPFIDFEN